ncbi:MAG: tetratricopeptide (TPR) repeat protein [Verrucomicrobiales bacterium]|jgi:tetratricopeptide (TPR) repeat protein
MKYRIPATAALAFGLLTLPAIAQEKPSIEASDKEAVEADATATLPDAPEKPAAAAAGDELPDSVKNLTPEQREKLKKLLNDASTYIGGIRIQEAFEKIIEAEDITPDLFQLHNLKGAAYTKIRDFEKARKSFERALELNPSAFMSQFNITELDFVEHKFPAAEKNFLKLLADSPKMNLGTKRLIEFKILISQLAQDKDAEANAIQEKFNFMEDTPAFYFGNAAFSFDKDDEDGARGWIRSAERIYSQQEVSVYVDSFIEMGWIDNLQ